MRKVIILIVLMLTVVGCSESKPSNSTKKAKVTTTTTTIPDVVADQTRLIDAIPGLEAQPAGFREVVRSNVATDIDNTLPCRGVLREVIDLVPHAFAFASYYKDPTDSYSDDGECYQYTTYSFTTNEEASKWFQTLKTNIASNAGKVYDEIRNYKYQEAASSAGEVARSEEAFGVTTTYYYQGEMTNSRFEVIALKSRFIVVVDSDNTTDSAKQISLTLLKLH